MKNNYMEIGITFNNDTYFSVSNKSEGINVVGHISSDEFEKMVKTHYFEILEVMEKLKEKQL